MQFKTFSKKTENLIFGFLLFTIAWIALPLGANRPWAWSLMQISAFVITIGVLLSQTHQLSRIYRQYKLFVYLWAAFLGWQLFNIIPLPLEVVNTLRPARLIYLTNNNNGEYFTFGLLKWIPLSFDVGQSKIVAIKSFAYCCIFFAILALINSPSRLKTILIVISATGIFQAIYGSLEVLSGIEHSIVFSQPVSHIATGTFIYKNHYANYLLLTLSVAIGYLVSTLQINNSASKREQLRRFVQFWLSNKVLFRIGIVLMVIALVMSRSRMGNSACFLSMTATATLGLIYFKPRQKSFIAFFLSMLVIDILIISSVFGLKEVQQRLENTTLTEESRDEVITDTLPLIGEYALLGAGGGTFYTLFPQVQQDSIQHFYDHAHNEYVQFLLEFGVVGSILIGAIVFICFVNAFSAMKTRRHPLPRGSAFACVMAILGMAMHSSVDFPLQAPANAFIFITLLALAIKSKNIKVTPVKSNKPKLHT